MWKQTAILVLASLLSQPALQAAELEAYTDNITADFTLTDINKQTHSLADYRGKVVLVNFWASWCLPCIHEMPAMNRLANALPHQDFALLTLNTSDSPRRIQETLKRLQLDFTVLQDHEGKTLKAWKGRVLPTSFLLDHTGRIRYRVVGPLEWDDEDVILKVKQLIQSH